MDENGVLNKINGVCLAIAEVIFELDLDQKEVWEKVKWYLVHVAKDKADAEDSNKTIASRIHLDRNSFADFLMEKPEPPKPSNLAMLLTVVKSNSVDGIISTEDFLQHAVEVMRSSLSPTKALEELLNRKTISFVDGDVNKIQILTEGLYTTGLSDLYLRIFHVTVLRIIRTMLHNKDAPVGKQLFHENFYSTQMGHKARTVFKEFTKKELKALSRKINDKIEELEDPRAPVGFYPEVGVSVFETFLVKNRNIEV